MRHSIKDILPGWITFKTSKDNVQATTKLGNDILFFYIIGVLLQSGGFVWLY
jgi:hypothetical protein